MPIWVVKFIAKRIIKAVKHKIDLNKIDKYVNKTNELDIQMKQVQKTASKHGKSLEEIDKDMAILKSDSHPPIFSRTDHHDILKRLEKLEKRS